ncbi:MAG TPA: hypothetical protein VFM63_15415 [Pyrinomonadaceae bacterium]|nr:hypothetical protein [Pyrinomonadaceae bacterium]
MKSQIALVLILLSFAVVNGQEATSAAETVDQIKLRLLDLQAKEEQLKYRKIELDEAIKPENIERSLAGVGSTRPEELREARRRQLTIERDSIVAQLKIVENTRTRLEAQLADAQGRAYQESARQTAPTQALVSQSRTSTRYLLFGAVGLGALALVAGLVIYRRAIKLR